MSWPEVQPPATIPEPVHVHYV